MSGQIVGVLGGMGPEATIEYMRRVVLNTPAADDADHIRLIVDNNPKVPSRIAALIEGQDVEPGVVMAQMAVGLEKASAQFLVITCNTAHHYLDAVQHAVTIPVLDVRELSAQQLAEQIPAGKVGLLASPAVQKIQLFEKTFTHHGLSLIYPNDENQERLLAIIRAVKAGSWSEKEQADYEQIAKTLCEQQGAQALMVACTELSLLSAPSLGVPVIDTLDLLVQATIHWK